MFEAELGNGKLSIMQVFINKLEQNVADGALCLCHI